MTKKELLAILSEDEVVTVKILRNRARCRKCNTIIESTRSHDFRMCACSAIGVDGGLEYIRRIGEPEDCEELSEFDLIKQSEVTTN